MSYLLMMLSVDCEPPTGQVLHSPKDGYVFYPVERQGAVWTLDDSVWRSCAGLASRVNGYFAFDLVDAIAVAKQDEGTLLVGTVQERAFRPVTSDEEINLPKLDEWLAGASLKVRKRLGYDVIDPMGLSALTNIGFLPSVAAKLSSDIKVNEFGLIEDWPGAVEFANVSNESASEHSPFVGVEVLAVARVASS